MSRKEAMHNAVTIELFVLRSTYRIFVCVARNHLNNGPTQPLNNTGTFQITSHDPSTKLIPLRCAKSIYIYGRWSTNNTAKSIRKNSQYPRKICIENMMRVLCCMKCKFDVNMFTIPFYI